MNEVDVLIKNKIQTIRGIQVMLDSDLAELYNVPVKRLNEQVRRNEERFPQDFMFQLSEDEYSFLRSQFATLNQSRGLARFAGARYVVATETNEYRAALAKKMGATRVVNPLKENLTEIMKELGMIGFDIGLECSGSSSHTMFIVYFFFDNEQGIDE